MNLGERFEQQAQWSAEDRDHRDHKECVVCGREIQEVHESILFECERCMNLQPE